MSIGYIKSEKPEEIFGEEFSKLLDPILIGREGVFLAAEVDSPEVLRALAYEAALRLLAQGFRVREVFLRGPGDSLLDSLGRPSSGGEVAFAYISLDPLSFVFDDLKSEEKVKLFASLNQERDGLARLGWSLVLWGKPSDLRELANRAKDFWSCLGGLRSFLIPKGVQIEPAAFPRDLTPVQAAELRLKALEHEERLASEKLSRSLRADHALRAAEIYEKLGEGERAAELREKGYEILRELEDLRALRSDYLKRLEELYRWLDFKGIRQMRIVVRLPLEEVFVPPLLAEEREREEPFYPEEVIRAGEEETERLRARKRLRPERPPIEVRELLRETKRAVILGDPGSGKTTLLKYLAYTLARGKDHLGLEESLFPVLLPAAFLAESPEGTLPEIISRYLRERQGYGDLLPLIEEELKLGRCLLLIDGLDEVIEPGQRIEVARRIEKFVSAYPENRYLVTSRIAGYGFAALAAGFKYYVLQGFDDDKIKEFLRRWFRALELSGRENSPTADLLEREAEEEARQLEQTIFSTPGIRRLASNPFLLTIIALVHRQARLPNRRVDLYRLCVETLAETWNQARSLYRPIDIWLGDKRLDEQLVEAILGPIAYSLHAERPGGLITRDELEEKAAQYFIDYEGAPYEEARRLARDFVELTKEQVGLIAEKGLNLFGFFHLTFEEYLAARYLIGWEEEKLKEEVKRRMHDPRWEEVILLAAASLSGSKAESLVKVIRENKGRFDDLFHRNLLLAARCLADGVNTRFETKREILNSLLELYYSTPYNRLEEECLKVISLFRGEGRIERLIIERALEEVNSEDSKKRRKGVKCLGRLGSGDERVKEALLKGLRDKDSLVRFSAAWVLGRIWPRDEEVKQAFLKKLEDRDPNVRFSIALALGRMGLMDKEVKQALLKGLKDKDLDVRVQAAVTLGEIGLGDKEVKQTLIERLNDEAPIVRVFAIQALGDIGMGDKEVKRILLERLEVNDHHVRDRAAWALGEIGVRDNEVKQALLERLEDGSPGVRASAAWALREIGVRDNEVKQALFKRLEDKDPYVGYWAARALGKIEITDEKIKQDLFKRLEAEDSRIRILAAFVLGEIGLKDDKVKQALLKGLEDEASFVRLWAALVLRKIEITSEDVLTALKEMIEREEDPFVADAAFSALWDLSLAAE